MAPHTRFLTVPIDLQRLIAERFGVVYHERTVGKILKQLGLGLSGILCAGP